ncbi:MAG: hypothetical protein R2798_13075 [Chitinophagales bacterium]
MVLNVSMIGTVVLGHKVGTDIDGEAANDHSGISVGRAALL